MINNKIQSCSTAALFLGAALLVQPIKAQLTLTGSSYHQNFNDLGEGLPTGWSVRTNASAVSLGASIGFTSTDKAWGEPSGRFGNCASTLDNSGIDFTGNESATSQGNCTNRALAVRQTLSFGDPGAAFVLQLTNTLGKSGFELDLDFLMLSVQSRSTTWTVDYAIGDNPVVFTPLATFDDPGVFGATHTNISLGSALDNQSSNIWIRVAALSASTVGGSRDTFGLDNFSLAWSSIAQPVITAFDFHDGAQIDFVAQDSDTPSSFLLVSAPKVDGTYTDVGAVITQLSAGQFRANCPLDGSQQAFYRIERP